MEISSNYWNKKLLYHIKLGCLNNVKFCLQKGADVNCIDKNGNSALHLAVNNESDDIVDFLVQYPGINLNISNHKHTTPITGAACNGKYIQVRRLLEAGANPFQSIHTN